MASLSHDLNSLKSLPCSDQKPKHLYSDQKSGAPIIYAIQRASEFSNRQRDDISLAVRLAVINGSSLKFSILKSHDWIVLLDYFNFI
jgi:hypothetical protein